MSKRKGMKTKAIQYPVPKTREAAELLLGEIGLLQTKVTIHQEKCNARVTGIHQAFNELVAPVNEEIEAKFQALHTYAEANRGELLKGDTKSVKFATGLLAWRRTPLAVKLTKIADVIKELKARGLERFIRTIEEIDKEALLACHADDNDPVIVDCIPGIKFTSREEFVAKPLESQIERVETVAISKGVPK
jgi:phage host-nuclease inhibitor protein Gam